MRRAIERFFGSPRIPLRGFILLLFALLLLGFLITFGVMRLIESTGKYNPRYYDPRDIQREEIIQKGLRKR
jgi:hypothetical protein